MTQAPISFRNVSKEYIFQEDRTFKDLIPALIKGSSWAKKYKAIDKATFQIEQGETVGFVGKNGAGKSTLLKLIAGTTYPTQGVISISQKVAPLIELGAGFHHELTGYENIFLNAAILGMHKKEIEAKIDQIIEFSELQEFIHVPVKRYSTGMHMRLGFSVAIHVDAPILLIDEVLAVGDEKFQNKCLKILREMREKKDKTIIFVSHDEKAVRSFCNRAILLNHGKIIADASPEVVFDQYHQLQD